MMLWKNKFTLYILLLMIAASSFMLGKGLAQGTLEHKLEVYLQVLDVVKNDFVEKDLDDTKLVYGSIKGLLSSLNDPYTRFVEPQAYTEMKVRMSGNYSGIGIYIGMKNDQLTVIAPIEATPAFLAGLKSGDKIVTVDGEDTKDKSLEEAVSKIRGPKGSKVTLGILRGHWKEPKPFVIVRDNIVIKPIKFKDMGSGIAYLKLNTFENVNAANDFEAALRSARKENYKALIVDVRGNGGGLLQNAIEIGSLFVDSGDPIVATVDREGNKEVMRSSGRVLWTKPTVLLIDGASASASEILAGALRDNKKATLVGSKTFGKASVQNVRKLSDGSALLITIAKYITPNGEDISKKGIEPEIVIDIPTPEANGNAEIPEITDENDPQLQEAIKILKARIKVEGHGKS